MGLFEEALKLCLCPKGAIPEGPGCLTKK